jgi:hypothetical protein
VDKYPTWEDNTVKPEQVRVVGEDIVPTQEKYTLNTGKSRAKFRILPQTCWALSLSLTLIALPTSAEQIAYCKSIGTQLILDKPFLGNLVLRLPLVAADSWCKTSATDAKSFYYNPEFIDSLNNHQIKFVLIHEALHCALTHFARRFNCF